MLLIMQQGCGAPPFLVAHAFCGACCSRQMDACTLSAFCFQHSCRARSCVALGVEGCPLLHQQVYTVHLGVLVFYPSGCNCTLCNCWLISLTGASAQQYIAQITDAC